MKEHVFICCVSYPLVQTISNEQKVKYFLWSWNEYSLLSTFCLDCTATYVVFLYLAKSNAFCCLSVLEPHTLFFWLLYDSFFFFCGGLKQKESNTVFVWLVYEPGIFFCVSVGVGAGLKAWSIKHEWCVSIALVYCFVYLILLRGFEMSKRLIYGLNAVIGW